MSTISSYFKPVATNVKKGETSGASPNIEKTKQKSQKTVNGKELSSEEESTIPWVEKYRPKKVDEVVCQEEVVAVLKKCVQGADLPNLLFYGPPGTGKTSAAVAMCHQLFRTATVYKDRVLEMNASDERGIDIVRNRIKEFARISISKQAKDALVPLKIVILDEADAMTGAAQSALRRTMESETQTTRFFLICNYITRIIEPLASRCAKFRFKPLSDEAQKKRLMLIAEKEQVKIGADALGQLVSISCGDLRKSITLLQSMACFGHGREINVEDVLEMSGQIPEEEFTSLLDAAGSLQQNKLLNCIKCLSRNGYSAIQFISQLADVINQNEQLKHGHKAKIFSRMAEAERRLIEGADEYLQLLELALTIRDCLMEVDELQLLSSP